MVVKVKNQLLNNTFHTIYLKLLFERRFWCINKLLPAAEWRKKALSPRLGVRGSKIGHFSGCEGLHTFSIPCKSLYDTGEFAGGREFGETYLGRKKGVQCVVNFFFVVLIMPK